MSLSAAADEPVADDGTPARENVAPAEDDREIDPVSGIERGAREPGDTGRTVGNALLFVPRNVIDLLFKGATTAAGLIADEQLVPRYRDLLGTKGGDIFIFPTVFAETGNTLNAGARMIVDSRYIGAALRTGYGGVDNLAVESRVLFKGGWGLPFAVSLEGLYERKSDEEYLGLGITPERDPRNKFRGERRLGLYKDKRVRGIASVGLRLSDEFEFFLSGSIYRRQLEDDPEAGDEALSRVFVPGTVPSFSKDTPWIGYFESAARFDSRDHPGRPTPGVLLEAYVGSAQELQGEPVHFMRLGARTAVSFPIYRRTNIVRIRAVVDRLIPLNHLDVPFYEVPRQPDFRGFDTRRDFLSAVGSVDYTWQLVPFMGLRLFLDGATVAPSLTEFDFDQIKNLRYAAGIGIDLFADTSRLGQLALSTSPEGARVLFTLGLPSEYGDRQHRD